MPAAILTAARDLALARGGAAATLVPRSGSGPIDCVAILRPERDEVADFPELRHARGAERPGWAFAFSQDDVPIRPVPGDRVTFAMGATLQVRGVRSDPHALWWVCVGFVVEDEVVTTDDAFMLPLYFAGVVELGL